MNDKTFVDTNVLVYAHDANAEVKRDVARAALDALWDSGDGVVSPQVMQEFYVTVTRKLATRLARRIARDVVQTYASWCIDVGPTDLTTAFRIEDEAAVGFWNALILASAVKAGARTLLSEDLNDGQMIAGVRIVNPFE